MNFLIVEDQDFKVEKIVSVISESIIGQDAKIYVNQNVADAVSFLMGDTPVDLMILDLNMPVRAGEDIKKGSGLNVIKEIRRRQEIIVPRSIIGLTAAAPIDKEHISFFQIEGWALITYNAASAEWEETITNKIHYLLKSPINSLGVKRKILYIGASPKDQDSINLGTEQRRIEEILRTSTFRDDFVLVAKQGTTFELLSRELITHNPEFLHLSGHGDDTGVALEDLSGLTCYVLAEALDVLLGTCKDIKCILLNSCYSAEQARVLSMRGVYVVGMVDSIRSNIAEEFAVGFYQAISERLEIPKAYQIALAHATLAQGKGIFNNAQLWYNGAEVT
jgi:CheY-like chemotaxis protein